MENTEVYMDDSKERIGLMLPKGAHWSFVYGLTGFLNAASRANAEIVIDWVLLLEDGVSLDLPQEVNSNVSILSNAWCSKDSKLGNLVPLLEKNNIARVLVPILYPYSTSGKVAEVLNSHFGKSVAISAYLFDSLGISSVAQEVNANISSVIAISRTDCYMALSGGISPNNIRLIEYPINWNFSDKQPSLSRSTSERVEIVVPAIGLTNVHYEQLIKAVYDLEKHDVPVRITLVRTPVSLGHESTISDATAEDYQFPKDFVSNLELRGLQDKIILEFRPTSISGFRKIISSAHAVLLMSVDNASALDRRGVGILSAEYGIPVFQSGWTGISWIDDMSLKMPSLSEKTLGAFLVSAFQHSCLTDYICSEYRRVRKEASTLDFECLIARPENTPLARLVENSSPVIVSLSEALPRILIQNRSSAFTHPGGDTVVMQKLADGLEKEGFDVVIDVENRENVKNYDLVHLFNFATCETLESQSKNCVANSTPFIVTSLYEDWPVFLNQMSQIFLALEAYVKFGQPIEKWPELESAAKHISPSIPLDNSFAALNAEAIITTGARESASVLRDYPGAKQVIDIPLGCEVSENFDGGALFKERFGLENFVLCVGRLEWRKNQLMLLKALEETDHDIVFAANSFTYQPRYSDLCKNFKRKGKTHFVDRLTPEELASAYQAARVHVLPSWFELPGLVTLEAGRYGTPVVASDTGSTRDYAGDIIEYCRPDSAESIRAGVERAWTKGRSEDTANHFKQYSWDATISRYAALYRSVIAAKMEVKLQSSQVGLEPEVIVSPTVMSVEIPSIAKKADTSVEAHDDYVELCAAGDKALGKGKPLEANSLFSRAFELRPELPRAIRSLGAVLIYEGKNEEAEPYFSRALAADPGDVRSLLGKGAVLWSRGEKEKAYSLYLQASDLDPGEASVVLYLVNASYELGKLSELETCLRKYLREKPENISIQYCLAGCYFKQEKYSAAMGIVERLLAISINNSDALELKGEIEKRLGRANQIEESKLPSAPVSSAQSAKEHLGQGSVQAEYQAPEIFTPQLQPQAPAGMKSDESIQAPMFTMKIPSGATAENAVTEDINESEDALAERPLSTQVSIEKISARAEYAEQDSGVLELHKLESMKVDRKYEEIISYTDRILGKEGYTAEAIAGFKVYQAEALGSLARIDESRELFTELMSQDYYKGRIYTGLGVLLAYEESWDKAAEFFEQALSYDTTADIPLAGLGMCARTMDNHEDSWNYFTEALRRNPENMQAMLGLIQLGYSLNRLEDVEHFLRTYLELRPVDLSILYSLAGCLYAQGRTGEALSELKNILIFEPEHRHAKELFQRIQDGSRYEAGESTAAS